MCLIKGSTITGFLRPDYKTNGSLQYIFEDNSGALEINQSQKFIVEPNT